MTVSLQNLILQETEQDPDSGSVDESGSEEEEFSFVQTQEVRFYNGMKYLIFPS